MRRSDAGERRAATLVALYLMRTHGWRAKEAMAWACMCLPGLTRCGQKDCLVDQLAFVCGIGAKVQARLDQAELKVAVKSSEVKIDCPVDHAKAALQPLDSERSSCATQRRVDQTSESPERDGRSPGKRPDPDSPQRPPLNRPVASEDASEPGGPAAEADGVILSPGRPGPAADGPVRLASSGRSILRKARSLREYRVTFDGPPSSGIRRASSLRVGGSGPGSAPGGGRPGAGAAHSVMTGGSLGAVAGSRWGALMGEWSIFDWSKDQGGVGDDRRGRERDRDISRSRGRERERERECRGKEREKEAGSFSGAAAGGLVRVTAMSGVV